MSPAAFPFAVTGFEAPLLLNVKPFELVGTNVHVPPPPLAVMVHREFDPIVTAMLVSVDANPAAVTVTLTPLGPDDGLNVRLATVPVNVAVAVSLALFPVAVTVFDVPLLLNEKPFAALAVNPQDPLPEPLGETVIVHRVTEVGPVTVMLVSVDAKPVTRTVTVIPLGPWLGLNVNAVMVPVNVC